MKKYAVRDKLRKRALSLRYQHESIRHEEKNSRQNRHSCCAKQTPQITIKYNDTTLTPDTDYEVSYLDENNQKITGDNLVNYLTNAGNKTVKITLTGNYSSGKTQPFNINKRSITPKIKEPDSTIFSKTYDGTTDAAKITNLDVEFETFPDGVTLTKNEDYTIDTTIFDNPNVGSNKKVTVTFISLLGNANTNYEIDKDNNAQTSNGEITQANPSYKSPEKTLTATYGDTLSYIINGLEFPMGVNADLDGQPDELTGMWELVDNSGANISVPIPATGYIKFRNTTIFRRLTQ